MNSTSLPFYCAPRVLAILLLSTAVPAGADVKLPHIFSDHMVLQKADKVPIWGTADPGEKVSVSVAGASGEATADDQGKWRVELSLGNAAEGPFQMKVQGKNQLEISDVLVGEVWVCSGQSNMALRMRVTKDATTEIGQSANPKLRQFLVTNKTSLVPLDDCEGAWTVAGHATTSEFSAAGYYFGKKLQNTLQVPVGLVNASYGGTPIEGWTSYEALSTDADLKAGADRDLKAQKDYAAAKQPFVDAYHAWATKYNRADQPSPHPELFAGEQVSEADWKKIKLPGGLAEAGFPNSGAIWLRKKITIPARLANADVRLELTPTGMETIYWNGQSIGGNTFEADPSEGGLRRYLISAHKVKVGENVLVVRLFNPAGDVGVPLPAKLFHAGSIPLAGEWMAKQEFQLPPLSDEARQSFPARPTPAPFMSKMATTLFNAMIHPIVGYGIRGIVWYQGEDNAVRAVQYRRAFPLMIGDWRSRWGRGDFPFYFCQLANYGKKIGTPEDHSWAELREAQSLTLSQPNTGEAILIDIGEADDIHPRDKRDVGERLASIALANTYGEKIPFSGPTYKSMVVEGDKIRLQFEHADGGLVAKPLPTEYIVSTEQKTMAPLVRNSPQSELEGFAICGEDRKWVWANARIDKGSVVVDSASVPKPMAVRYAWGRNPTCNFYNSAGFPAGPFRTDAFPSTTETVKY